MNDLGQGAAELNPRHPVAAYSGADDLEQLTKELRDLELETSRLEGEIRERTAQLLGKFDASFPPLKVVDISSIPPSELQGWLLAGEA